MALAGVVLGNRYVLDQPIGDGGYSEVWQATDTVLSRFVAIKILHPGYARQREALARFKAEARHAGSLSHQNIAQVHDYGEPADGQPPYLVMELVHGPSLVDVLADGPLDATRSMDVIAQAAAGLEAAHAVGLIHRDIKPANLLLASGGTTKITVKITDFGIAHAMGSASVTGAQDVLGTPGYLAPERTTGAQATPSTDLYALGVVAYECLAGASPFTGTALEITLAHRDRPLPPLPASVPDDVSAFVMQLTAKDPAWRPGSAAEVAAHAGRLRDGLAGSPDVTPVVLAGAGPGGQPEPNRPGRHRNGRIRRRAVLTFAGFAFVAVVVLTLASVIGFASVLHPFRAHSSAPSGSSRGDVAAQPATRPAASPAASPHAGPAKPPAASPTARQVPAGNTPTATPTNSGRGQGHGNGNGNGQGNGNSGHGHSASGGVGAGQGNG